ncbi:MAG: hypothetical protein RLZZ301_1685 [Bacteroidota bacterium]|jgi:apolipoprotein N-acyltransferase
MKWLAQHPFLPALLGGLFLSISFPFSGSLSPLVFCGFALLVYARQQLFLIQKKAFFRFFSYYSCFFTWNLGSTWWVANASFSGAALAIGVNSLLMALVFSTWSSIQKREGSILSYWLLIPFWILFEYGHHRWDLSWPWLTLGNYFSIHTGWVQWYELTGTLGGSAWIIVVNLLVFNILNSYQNNQFISRKNWIILALSVLVPIGFSQLLLFKEERYTNGKKLNAVVVQPNVDPYTEKFAAGTTNEQLVDSFLRLANRHVDPQTDLVLGPETALAGSFLEFELEGFPFGQRLKDQVWSWPKAQLLIGASTVRLFDQKQSVASNPVPNAPGRWYENYNTSLLVSKNQLTQYVHKSKLVPGVELIPFSAYFPFLAAIAIENGGSSGTLGTEKEPQIIQQVRLSDTVKLAPIVCYESIYGDFVRQQVVKGAELLCILTNDGWWGNTPGYKQHFSFARLRAIETRRWVLRSANTGTSGSIDPCGKIVKRTSYWHRAAFQQQVELRQDLTFYAQYGDWLAGIALLLTLAFLSWKIFLKFSN